MPRPREFDPDAALDQILALFWEKGYGDSSFEDIVKTAGVSRYGLYEAFGSKRELFLKALQAYEERVKNLFQFELRQPDAALPEIQGYFATVLELSAGEAAHRGCLVWNTAVEMARSDEEIVSHIRSWFEEMVAMFRNALGNARDRGEISPNLCLDDWAVNLTALSQSSTLMMRLDLGTDMVRRNIRAAMSALENR